MHNYLKRIILDIKDINNSPIDHIYYIPNEDNICQGTALIIGPKDTPYANGFYFFDFEFPDNYPHSPPTVKYMTNDGNTRFNPNFYRNGKVCLSILNTWEGEPWSSCQSLRSVLITLQMTMNDRPLLNEPGINEAYHKHKINEYNEIIEYKNIDIAILKMISVTRDESQKYHVFHDYIMKSFKENFVYIMDFVEKKCEMAFGRTVYEFSTMYKMSGRIDYIATKSRLLQEINY